MMLVGLRTAWLNVKLLKMKTLGLILSFMGRTLAISLQGGLAMGGIGVAEGFVAGPICVLILWLHPSWRSNQDIISFVVQFFLAGPLMGAFTAGIVGAVTGLLAFIAVGIVSCFSRLPDQVFLAAVKSAGQNTIIGVTVCSISGAINFALINARLLPILSDAWEVLKIKQSTAVAATDGFYYGAIIGFVLGTFYGAIAGALREAKHQRN